MTIWEKLYNGIAWKNRPNVTSPLNETNLLKIDNALTGIDDRVIKLNISKLDAESAKEMIKDIDLNLETGILTVYYYDGSIKQIPTNMAKIAVNIGFDEENERLVLTMPNGTESYVDMSALITQYEFLDSDTIAFNVEADGKVKATLKKGSVRAEMIQPDYLAEVQLAASQAKEAATEAEESMQAASASEKNAVDSAEAALTSEQAAAVSEKNAMDSEEAAKASETEAKKSEEAALASEQAANTSKQAASENEKNTLLYANAAEESKAAAGGYAAIAEENAQTATDNSILAKSYAVGGTGTRSGEDTDNAKYYMEQARSQAGGIPTKLSELENDAGFITMAVDNLINYYKTSMVYTKTEVDTKLSSIPKFGIKVVDSLPTEDISSTTIYLLKEQESGTNRCSEWVYIDNTWEMLGHLDIDLSIYLQKTGDGSNLTEVFAEASTLENISAGEKHQTIFGKIAKVISTMIAHISAEATTAALGHVKVDSSLSTTSTNPIQNKAVNTALSNRLEKTGDASNTTAAFTEAVELTELESGEKHSVSMGKLKLAVKNLKTLITLMGTTDISAIGDGTATGAISTLNDSLSNKLDINGNANTATTALYVSTPASDGYSTDASGNFIHRRTTDTDYFQLISNDSTKALKYYWETGKLDIPGEISTNGVIYLSAGGMIGTDGNVWINGNGYADWLTNILNGKANSSHTHGYLPLSGGTVTGEIIVTSANAFRVVYDNYGFFIRNDGDNTYFMLTNSGDQYGAWNSLRPLTISNSTGEVSFGNGIRGRLFGNADTATTALYVSTPDSDGYSTDASGNFIHRRTTDTDYFQLISNDSTKALKYCWETGKLDIPYIGVENIGGKNYASNSVAFGSGGVVIKSSTGNLNLQSTATQSRNYDNSAWAPMYASAFTQQSSIRYKKNISDLTEEEAKQVLQYRPVSYDYINEADGTNCMGMIAEEVADINTYPVVYDSEGNPEGLDYSKFVPQLIKMIQMQQKEIDELYKLVC